MALANPNNLSVRVIKKAIVEVSGVEKEQHYGIKNNITTGRRETSPQEEEQHRHRRRSNIAMGER